MVIPIVIGVHGAVTKGLVKGNKNTSGEPPNDSSVKIGQNPRNFRRLVVTQTPGKDHQLMLV